MPKNEYKALSLNTKTTVSVRIHSLYEFEKLTPTYLGKQWILHPSLCRNTCQTSVFYQCLDCMSGYKKIHSSNLKFNNKTPILLHFQIWNNINQINFYKFYWCLQTRYLYTVKLSYSKYKIWLINAIHIKNSMRQRTR